MKDPDFDELVGDDLDDAERARLRRVHDLLIAAGPPPDYAPEAPPVPSEAKVIPFQRRRTFALVALAAALAIATFGGGYFVGDHRGGPERTVAMAGTGQAVNASASLELFPLDEAGNWPMELVVRNLKPSPSGRAYELWLAKGGKLSALCGSFRAEPDGSTSVRMNAPYKLTDFDSWVVVEEGTETPVLTT